MCCTCEDQKHVAYEDTLTPEEIAYYDSVWEKLQKYVQYKDMHPKCINIGSIKGVADDKLMKLVQDELNKIEYNTFVITGIEKSKFYHKNVQLHCEICGCIKICSICSISQSAVPRCSCNFIKRGKRNTSEMYLIYMLARKMGMTCTLDANQEWKGGGHKYFWHDENGHQFKKTFEEVIHKKFWNCKKCGHKKGGDKRKITTTEFYQRCKKVGALPLPNQVFGGVSSKMWFYCIECGEPYETTLKSVIYQNQLKCKCCSGANYTTHEQYCEKLFEKHNGNIEIIEEYSNSSTKTKHKCNVCGYGESGEWKPTPNDILNGHGCPECARKKISEERKGEKNPSYNPNISEEERKNKNRYRDTPEEKQAKKETKKRDNYTCQCCKKIGCNLHSHHIYPKNLFRDLRDNETNLITLCEECHFAYHSKYGCGVDCNPYTLIDFLGWNRIFSHNIRIISGAIKLVHQFNENGQLEMQL